jgi:Flp pilus assembly pilin Flp
MRARFAFDRFLDPRKQSVLNRPAAASKGGVPLMNTLRHLLVRIQLGQLHREEGQTMAEYGLLIAFIAIIALVGVKLVGSGLSSFFSDLAGNF